MWFLYGFLHVGKTELIDTCWDVNTVCILYRYPIHTELIDTCWDVNSGVYFEFKLTYTELIDTCWDVNFSGYHTIDVDNWN